MPTTGQISAHNLSLGDNLTNQHTVAAPASVSGMGLHTGVKVNLRLCPAPANTGILFRRTDLEGFTIEAPECGQGELRHQLDEERRIDLHH